MQLITAFVFVINFLSIKCNVLFSKNGDETSVFPTNKTDLSNKSSERVHSLKTFDLNKGSLYLEDVVFALTNQNWTKEEEPCLNRTLLWLYSLQNFTLWAVWNWDSVSSQPQGLLYGSSYHLGNFDECMNPPWYEEQPELRSQYCLADVILEGPDNAMKKRTSYPYDPYQSALNFLRYKSYFQRTLNELTWGVCVPDVCHPMSVEKLIGVMLAHSHLGTAGMRASVKVNECQQPNNKKPYDGLFYAFLGTVVILVTISLVCTYLNRDRRNSDTKTLRDHLIGAFDLRINAGVLLKQGKQDMSMFYGIKFITMCVIISGHQYGAFNGTAVSNGLQVDMDATRVLGGLFLHKDLAVDTFFMMSGFLMASSLSKKTKIPNLFLTILSRYMRLIAAYAMVIFYVCSIYSYTGSGPLWNKAAAAETEPCRRNWWLNLILLNNYVDTENLCLVVSWYIPCDFHFFVLTLLILWIYRRFPSPGKLLFIIITIAAIATPGVVNYINELPATQLFTYDFLKNPRSPKQFHLTYIKSHTRYAAYLVGFFSGWLYTYYTSTQNLRKIARKYAVAGTFIGIILMGTALLTGSIFLERSYDVLESAVYASLNRPVWAFGITLFVVCCSLGSITFFKNFFSWYPFVPLSKLTYGLYLVHNLIILRNMFITRNPNYNDYMYILSTTLGTIGEGTFAAFLIWLFVEAPVKNIFYLCVKSCDRSRNENEKNSHETPNGDKREAQYAGYIQENLPTTTVEIICSKI